MIYRKIEKELETDLEKFQKDREVERKKVTCVCVCVCVCVCWVGPRIHQVSEYIFQKSSW